MEDGGGIVHSLKWSHDTQERMGEGRWLRVRSVIGRWFAVVVVGCLLTAGAGAVVVHGAYVDPGTQQEQRTVDEWRASGSFSHEATVVDAAGTPFEAGQTVRNRSVYLQRVMPVLSGEFTFRTPGAGAPVNLTVDRRLVVESTSGGTVDETPTVYWRDTMPLGTTRTTKSAGEPVTVPFEVNVSRTVAEARNVSERLDSPGGIQTRVEVAVEATRRTEGAVTRSLSYSLPLSTESGVYRVGDGADSEPFSDRETVTVPNEPGTVQRLGGPLLLAVGLAGALATGGARYRGLVPLSASEREWLAYRDDRADYAEWVSTVRLPDEAWELPTARAATLADLVDLAIDTDSAVIEAPDSGVYHVVNDGYRYTYEAPPAPEGPLSAAATADDDPASESSEPTATGGGTDPLGGESDSAGSPVDTDDGASASDDSDRTDPLAGDIDGADPRDDDQRTPVDTD